MRPVDRSTAKSPANNVIVLIINAARTLFLELLESIFQKNPEKCKKNLNWTQQFDNSNLPSSCGNSWQSTAMEIAIPAS